MEKRTVGAIIAVVVIVSAAVAGWIYIQGNMGEKSITVFAAGSLAVPLGKLAEEYEKTYGVRVNIETAGSIETVKKISELHRSADVVAVADYKAITGYLMPEYTSWYIKFARNELVIAYTNQSKYAGEISEDNWWKILSKEDVRVGFSSPNDDPCGYRAVMMFYLADIAYNGTVFRDVVENNTEIEVKNGKITVPDDSDLLDSLGRVFIKQKSVALLGDLESGNIDYAIEYLSVAKQHGLRYIRLPEEINLSNSSLADFYSRAVVVLADGKEVRGSPINYAITVPNNAPNRELAYRFVKMLIGEDGKRILEECGQPPMYEEYGEVPEEIRA